MVDLFQYLGGIMAQDDNNIRAVRSQIKKARDVWALRKPDLGSREHSAQD
jgi:hypothetical protein